MLAGATVLANVTAQLDEDIIPSDVVDEAEDLADGGDLAAKRSSCKPPATLREGHTPGWVLVVGSSHLISTVIADM